MDDRKCESSGASREAAFVEEQEFVLWEDIDKEQVEAVNNILERLKTGGEEWYSNFILYFYKFNEIIPFQINPFEYLCIVSYL